MADILLPPWLNWGAVEWRYVGADGVSPAIFNGPVRTTDLNGSRLAGSFPFTVVGGPSGQRDRGALTKAMASLRGKQNRAYFTNQAARRASPGGGGSFPAPELISNNTFANGTTGFDNAGSNGVLSVSDRVMRVTRSSSSVNPQVRQQATVTQYAPYAGRAMLMSGRGSQTLRCYLDNGSFTLSSSSDTQGLATVVTVNPSTTLIVGAFDAITSGGVAGDYFEVPYMSLARCALVDGGTNLLQRSDEFDQSPWSTSAASISVNAATAPDGTSIADRLVDTGVNTDHYVSQSFSLSSATQDLCLSVAARAAATNFVSIQLLTATGFANVICDLTTGTLSSLTGSSALSNQRAFSTNLGNGWFRVSIVCRKTTSETAGTARIYSANSSSGGTYTGSGTAAIDLWRATVSISGTPSRLKQTTSTAATSSESQRTSGVHLKGLLASTNDLLLPGDEIEVIGGRGSELKIVTAPLHSDSAGLGYVQFEPPMRSSPSDNAAVIVNQPMGRFIFTGDTPSWSTEPGSMTQASLEMIEAV